MHDIGTKAQVFVIKNNTSMNCIHSIVHIILTCAAPKHFARISKIMTRQTSNV